MTPTPLARYDGAGASPSRLQLRVTVDSVRRWKFDSTSFARRGYDPQAVERFRLQVADELDLLQDQLAEQRTEVERLQAQVELHRHGVLPASASPAPAPTAREINLLSSAQREAEQIVAQAHDYARKVAEYAREQYAIYMQQAVQEAKAEAGRIIEEYRRSTGLNLDDSAVAQETLRVVGEMMASHMEAAARQLDAGVQQISRAMQTMSSRSNAAIGGAHHA